MALDADRWPDEMRLSDVKAWFVCQGCGSRGADVRPDFETSNSRLAIVGHWTGDQSRSSQRCNPILNRMAKKEAAATMALALIATAILQV